MSAGGAYPLGPADASVEEAIGIGARALTRVLEANGFHGWWDGDGFTAYEHARGDYVRVYTRLGTWTLYDPRGHEVEAGQAPKRLDRLTRWGRRRCPR